MKTTQVQLSRATTALRALPVAALLIALCAAPAWAEPKETVSAFGTVIDKPGHYVLTADLDSGGDPGPAIAIVADHVHLDLNGHSITGNGELLVGDNLGIWIFGTPDDPRSHVHVSNGSISGFHSAVWMDHTTKSHVTEMTVSGNRGGIGLNASSKNQVKRNSAVDNFAQGILLQSNSNQNDISHNNCRRNTQGIMLQFGSNENHLKHNICNENLLVGIWLILSSNGNKVVNNEVIANRAADRSPNGGIGLGFPGVAAYSVANNKIVGNTVLDNTRDHPLSWDVFDASICENLWRGNEFVKDNEGGDAAGPGVGCIR